MTCDITTGLVAYYKFSNNGNDSSGNGNNLSFTGGAAYANDKNGTANQAYSLDGSADYADLSSGINFGTSWGISLWAYATTTGTGDTYVMGRVDASNYLVFGYQVVTTSKVEGTLNVGGTSAFVQETTAISTNTWTHYVLTCDGATLYLYKNKNLEDSVSLGVNPPSFTFRIGADLPTANNKHTGRLDEIRFYDAYLDSDSVDALFDGYDDPSCAVNGSNSSFFGGGIL